MKLTFRSLARGDWLPDSGKGVAFLKSDNWDDYSFKTLFHLTVFDEEGNSRDIGAVKIGTFGQKEGTHTRMPSSFKQLSKKYFSLGQEAEYYQNIATLSIEMQNQLLSGLHDLVQDYSLFSRALDEDVTKTSLLRNVSESSVTGQFSRILAGGVPLTSYNFRFEMPQRRNRAGFSVDFSVDPDSSPPSNIHVLIGRNGVGKTHLLNKMVEALAIDPQSGEVESDCTFLEADVWGAYEEQPPFAGVVSVAFSAFDPFDPLPEQKDKTRGVRYSYIGLRRSSNRGGKRGTPMSHEMLTREFVKSLAACSSLGKADRWLAAIQILESDPLFNEISPGDVIDRQSKDFSEESARSLFTRVSSGHGIVLLTITKLVEKVEEKTLVLIDEPESHLHPPLLSAFIRALSDLLSYRNGVAIVATHSPVVLQEVPRDCVWKLRRSGMQADAERPQIETFGENVGILTREAFGLEVTESGYHKMLLEALENRHHFDPVVEYFEGQLGTEARGILRSLIAQRDRET